MAVASAMKERYDSALRDELRKQFGFKNVMQIPRTPPLRTSRRSPVSVR
jgi:hypothetical protein